MKKRSSTNFGSWASQAKIHFNNCPHSNWFFLPWHRAFIKYFEDLCRQASGDPNFSLPYWDWTTNPQIPAIFFEPGSPLVNTTRKVFAGATASSEFVGPTVMSNILSLNSYEEFGSLRSVGQRDKAGSGLFEASPHNYIHRWISGDMSTMNSPRDAIFWMHHANVDRIWTQWIEGGRSNPDDPAYKSFPFTNNFYNINGSLVTVQVGDMYSTEALGYRYDTQAPPPPPPPPPPTDSTAITSSGAPVIARTSALSFSTTNTKVMKKNQASSFAIQAGPVLNSNLSPIALGGKPEQALSKVSVVISNIQPPQNEDFFVRVFINAPNLSEKTPITDPHYVGSFTFFGSIHLASSDMKGMAGMDHSSHNQKLKFVLDATQTIRRVLTSQNPKLIKKEINVQLLAIPLRTGAEVAFLPGKIDLVFKKTV